jgi:hypothetical protein
MDAGDIVSSVIAAVSTVIAGISLFVAVRFARRQTRLQEQVVAIEQGRRDEEVEGRRHALVRAEVETKENGLAGVIRTHGNEPVVVRSGELILSNHGAAVARSVGFTLLAETKGSLPRVAGTEILPLAELHPGVPMTFPVGITRTDCRIMLAEVSWTDDAGPHNRRYKVRLY